MSEASTAPCPICNGPGVQITEFFEGYVEAWLTTILECAACDVSYSANRAVPDGLYNSIYTARMDLPGYDRYEGYARAVREQADPLAWLARREGPYAAVAAHLASDGSPGPILEIGSGLGYLTYALRRAGFDAVGVDLSETAVESARSRFGEADAYFTPDELRQVRPDGFSLVIGLEIIEHVDDLAELVKQALDYCGPDGRALFTTPNRDVAPVNVMWESDLPPVHLTWLGTRSLEALAAHQGLTCSFVPLAGQFRRATPPVRDNLTSGALLDTAGEARGLARYWRHYLVRWIDARPGSIDLGVRLGRRRLVGLARRPDSPCNSTTLGVVFRRA